MLDDRSFALISAIPSSCVFGWQTGNANSPVPTEPTLSAMRPPKYVDGQTGHGTVAKEEAVQTAAGKRTGKDARERKLGPDRGTGRTWTRRWIIKSLNWSLGAKTWHCAPARCVMFAPARGGNLASFLYCSSSDQTCPLSRVRRRTRIKMSNNRVAGLDSCSALEILKVWQPATDDAGLQRPRDPSSSPNQGFFGGDQNPSPLLFIAANIPPHHHTHLSSTPDSVTASCLIEVRLQLHTRMHAPPCQNQTPPPHVQSQLQLGTNTTHDMTMDTRMI